MGPEVAVYHYEAQDHGLAGALDHQLIEQTKPALERGEPVRMETPIRNTNRTPRRYGGSGSNGTSNRLKPLGSPVPVCACHAGIAVREPLRSSASLAMSPSSSCLPAQPGCARGSARARTRPAT